MVEKGQEFTAFLPETEEEVVTITNANLFSESYNAVETFLKDNLTDPRDRYKTNWIHASMPRITAKGFEGYPFIILTVDVREDRKSFDTDISQKIFIAKISIYSDQPTDIESVSDEIGELFRDETKLTDFDARAFNNSPISWTLDQNGKKVLFRDITLNLRSRI